MMSEEYVINDFQTTQTVSYKNKYSDSFYPYGYDIDMTDDIMFDNHSQNINIDDVRMEKINPSKGNSRKKTVCEINQLMKMSEILCRSSFKFSPIDDTIDKELTRSRWTREEIALFCLRSLNNNIKRAIKSYKSFTMMMYRYNSKNGNEIDIRNPAILSQLRTGKVVILDKLDLHGRLIIIINLHYHDPKLQTVDDLILLFVFVIELIMRENPHNCAAERNGISILINASKIRFVDFRIEYCLRIAQLLTNNFPIKLGQILIFKPRRLVKFSIKLVLLTHKGLKKRFQIINKVFEPLNSITDFEALSHFIDRKNIPIEFGGKHEFVSDRFWELKYQGHFLAELFQKRNISVAIEKPIKKRHRNQNNRRYRRKQEQRNLGEGNDLIRSNLYTNTGQNNMIPEINIIQT